MTQYAPTITEVGITAPTYASIYAGLVAEWRSIDGADLYLDPDSQDGQRIALQALAISDANAAAIASYNTRSPASSSGEALSSVVRINGIQRAVASYSTVDLTIIGQNGTIISNGHAKDIAGNKWKLPATVTIPGSGEIVVTATASELGAISAGAGDITEIATPQYGWQSVNNVYSATPGAPVESDAELRARQKLSTAIPSLTVFEGIIGAVALLPGVSRLKGFENDTESVDINGITPHSISLVVDGGDSTSIANTIARKKTPGTGTHGATNVTTYDRYGQPLVVRFDRPATVVIGVEITISVLPGFTSISETLMAEAVASTINALTIGDDVIISKLYSPGNLPGNPAGSTYDITGIRIKADSGSFGATNIELAYNEVAGCDPVDNVTVIVA